MVFDEATVNNFKLISKSGQKPIDALLASTMAFVSALDVSKDFDALSQVPTREVNFFENMIATSSQNSDLLKKMVSDSNYVVRVLELNCWILLDMCCKILDKVVDNYQVTMWKSQEEMDKLKVDFKDYFLKRIVKDTRYLGKHSPKSINSLVEGICSDVWGRTKKKMAVDLDTNRKNKVVMSYKNRSMFKRSYLKLFKDEVETATMSTLKSVPREEIFLYHSYKMVRNNIDTLVDNSFNQMVCSMKDSTEQLKLGLSNYLNNMLSPSTQYRYKYFQVLPNLNIDEVLSLPNRKGIVLAALIATPKNL